VPASSPRPPEQSASSRRSPIASGLSDVPLLRTKLLPPPVRPGLVPRSRLEALLEAGVQARLCLLDAPAGSGKTTLLAQWGLANRGSREVGWLSLDEGDNDPARFWLYVIEAFRSIEPRLGEGSLKLLQGAGSVELLNQMILPRLLNELGTVDSDLVLVLDDHHLLDNSACHQSLAFFIDRLPTNVHLLLATRSDPPLPLARLRARGELAEIRIADLEFTDAEAATLLNDAMGLELTAQDVQRLWERTEGWAAGLYLAGLSLRGRKDPGAFIATFEAGQRHILDYLGTEVLARQPEPLKTFMIRTSILQTLSGSLCDAVLEANNSGELLIKLERTNQFLVPLDDRRQWYRYHHLFAELLRLGLIEREPELVPVLHRRALAWHRRAGDLEAAIHHATAAGEFAQAADLICHHAESYFRRGQVATLERWVGQVPDDVIAADPLLSTTTAWIKGLLGGTRQEVERWLLAAEAINGHQPVPGRVAFDIALARGVHTFEDVGRSLTTARRAVELADPRPSQDHWSAAATLGRMLYLSGQTTEARAVLEEAARDLPPADRQPYAVVNTLALLSLLADDDGDDTTAAALAQQAMDAARAEGISLDPLNGIIYIALGRAAARRGALADAERLLEQVLQLLKGIDSFMVQYAQALLEMASIRRAQGATGSALASVEQARALISQFTDPGMLPSLLDRTTRGVRGTAHLSRRPTGALTERELVVLRLLPTRLSTRDIARELSVSVTTIRSQVQAIYRKLQVASRAEAVTQARRRRLLPEPGPATTSRTVHPPRQPAPLEE
jgi:LuxR family transcriptional regulator, maltose regulon positive regulatory protein